MTDADDDVDAWKEMAADNDEEEDVDFGAIVQQTQSLDDGSGLLAVVDRATSRAVGRAGGDKGRATRD